MCSIRLYIRGKGKMQYAPGRRMHVCKMDAQEHCCCLPLIQADLCAMLVVIRAQGQSIEQYNNSSHKYLNSDREPWIYKSAPYGMNVN